MPWRASVLFTQTSGQPSSAMMGRPERTVFIRCGTSPPTPAMHDISATPRRSSCSATWLASCAALEQPEQEYTSGKLRLSSVMAFTCMLTRADTGRPLPRTQACQQLERRPLLQVEYRQLQGIERILDDQAQLGVALHGEAAAEKNRVRIFLALRQAHEIVGAGTDGQVGGLQPGTCGKALPRPRKVKGQACVAHV